MEFRKDINGLRAFAVIAVVLYHFDIGVLLGGFAGVDVFFVISGYLMTGIIFKGLENDSLSLTKFYLSRAKRIIPALAVLCFSLFIFGWIFLSPYEFKSLGKHIAGGMTFVSNIVFWQESGYFDVHSLEKWLLHTWSLSLEWQFYILYPIILLLVKKVIPLPKIKYVIVLGAITSYILCEYVVYLSSQSAFYLLPTRAWEMMVGAIAFLFPVSLSKGKRTLTEGIGLLLIIASYFLLTSKVLWPGHYTLVPVLGTFLVILACNKGSIFTENKIFQIIGSSSYSIYLWHWPILIFINKYIGKSAVWYGFGIILSFLFGYLFYRLIEKNIPLCQNDYHLLP